jgi:integrase
MHPVPLYRRMYDAWDAAGLERLRPHQGEAQLRLDVGGGRVGIEKLSRRMGHSSIQVTWDRYGHLYRHSEDEERELLNACIANRRTHGRTHEDREPHE